MSGLGGLPQPLGPWNGRRWLGPRSRRLDSCGGRQSFLLVAARSEFFADRLNSPIDVRPRCTEPADDGGYSREKNYGNTPNGFIADDGTEEPVCQGPEVVLVLIEAADEIRKQKNAACDVREYERKSVNACDHNATCDHEQNQYKGGARVDAVEKRGGELL
jgi:hypothetical protein